MTPKLADTMEIRASFLRLGWDLNEYFQVALRKEELTYLRKDYDFLYQVTLVVYFKGPC